MRRLATTALLLVALTLSISASGGVYEAPVGDYFPVWSPDGSVIVYWEFPGGGPHVVNRDGTHDRRLAGLPGNKEFAFAKDWTLIAFNLDNPEGTLVVMKPDGSERRVVATGAVGVPAFSPDGRILAYATRDDVRIVGADGSRDRRISADVPASPAGLIWSPFGARVAYATFRPPHGSAVDVVNVSSGVITRERDGTSGPSWSPRGSKLAFFRDDPPTAVVVDDAAGRRNEYPEPAGHSERPLWTDDGASLVFSAGKAMRHLDLATGATTAIGPSSSSVALFGSQVAYNDAGPCADRAGIYVLQLTAPHNPTRLTNDCHVYGTPGPDRLTSSDTLYEIVDGRGGNDVLIGAPAPYVGDSLVGGAGNDSLRGDDAGEILDGGPGNDTIYGGAGPDVITGGPGSDRIYGQRGRDTIYARDGRRDVVDCGTNGPYSHNKELDIAYVDRVDIVTHCEKVVRR